MKVVWALLSAMLVIFAFYTPKETKTKIQRHSVAGNTFKRLPSSTAASPAPSSPEISHIEKTYARIVLDDGRQIRTKPTTTSEACGQFKAGDVVYADPHPAQRPRSEGWVWTKAYIPPGNERLTPGKCPRPNDGLFWVALVRI